MAHALILARRLLRTKTTVFTMALCTKLSLKTHRDMEYDSTTRSCHHAADDDDPRPHSKPLDTRHKHHTSRTVSTNLNGKQHHCWDRDYAWTGRVCPADRRKLCESCARVKRADTCKHLSGDSLCASRHANPHGENNNTNVPNLEEKTSASHLDAKRKHKKRSAWRMRCRLLQKRPNLELTRETNSTKIRKFQMRELTYP